MYTRSERYEIAPHSSPLRLAVSATLSLGMLHALVTFVFHLVVVLTDLNTLLDHRILASKAAHIFFPCIIVYYACLAQERTALIVTRKVGILDWRLFLVMMVGLAMLLTDTIIFIACITPDITPCFHNEPLDPADPNSPPHYEIPPYCDDTHGNTKIAFDVVFALSAIFIFLDVLVLIVAWVARKTTDSDSLYETTETTYSTEMNKVKV